MSETLDTKGSCLCGAVELHASSMSTEVGACHCGMCRKWSGGPFLGVDCGTSIDIRGQQYITSYSSSDWAKRSFCSKCGTHLFYQLEKSGQYIVPVGLFGEAATLKFDHQIFIDEKPDYYTFADETKNLTGEEVFAQFLGE